MADRRSSSSLASGGVGLAFSAIFVLSGCGPGPHQVEMMPAETSAISLDRAGVDRASVQLDLKSGQLELWGGTEKLVDGQFTFHGDAGKPQVHTTKIGPYAEVSIEEPERAAIGNHGKNTWDLKLNEEVLLDLLLNCGAGSASLEVGSLNLRKVQVHMGVGKLDLDLTGHPARDYEVEVAGGIGQATIRLPRDVGIRADIHGGLGQAHIEGLDEKNGHYENSLFESAKVNVRLNISGGIGEIRILE